MSPINLWGPAVWILFHTLIEKLTDEGFNKVGLTLFNYIKRISYNLPCPDCSQHAIKFLSRLDISKIKTKTDLRDTIYIFHNIVNKRTNKSMYNVNHLEKYKNLNTIAVYNNFISHYNTKGNMKLLAETFQRQKLITEFKKWLMHNISFFI